MRTHQEIDQRSLILHRFVVDKIRRDPTLFDLAKATLARWRTTGGAASQPYLAQWQALVDEGMEACLHMAVEESQRGDALRQSSPFSGILSNSERFKLLKTWNKVRALGEPYGQDPECQHGPQDRLLSRAAPSRGLQAGGRSS